MKKWILIIILFVQSIIGHTQGTGSGNQWYSMNLSNRGLYKITAYGDYAINQMIVNVVSADYNSVRVYVLSEYNYPHLTVKVKWGYIGSGAAIQLAFKAEGVNTTASSINIENVSNPLQAITLTATTDPVTEFEADRTLVSFKTNANGDNPHIYLNNPAAQTNIPGETRAGIWLDNDGVLKLRNVTSKGFAFRNSSNSADNIFIKDDGSMGIGTNPSQKFHLNGGILRVSGGPTGAGEINLDDGVTEYSGFQIRKEGSYWALKSVAGGNDLALFTDNVNSRGVYIKNSNGNVGIGTSTPHDKLELDVTSTDDNNYLSFLNNAGWTPGKINNIVWRDAYGITGALGMKYDGTLSTVDFVVNSLYNSGRPGTSAVPFIVKGNGNVGIGTTSPGAKLTVEGSGSYILVNGSYSNYGDGDINKSSYRILAAHSEWDPASGGGAKDIITVGFGGQTDMFTKISAWSRKKTNGNYDVSNYIAVGENGNSYTPGNFWVKGNIKTTMVKVTQTDWPDYVFTPAYKLLSLSELENYINKCKHLPDVPSADEVAKEGLDVGGNQAVLLKKIEELTLYVIEQSKELKAQKEEIERQKEELKKLKLKMKL